MTVLRRTWRAAALAALTLICIGDTRYAQLAAQQQAIDPALLDEDTLSAEDMLLRLSDLLRAFLEDYDGQEVSLAGAVEIVVTVLKQRRPECRSTGFPCSFGRSLSPR